MIKEDIQKRDLPGDTFYITPINPFSLQEARVATLSANGHSVKEIARELKMKSQTVKTILSGNPARGQEGVYRVIKKTGKPISGRRNLIQALLGDVLFFRTKTLK